MESSVGTPVLDQRDQEIVVLAEELHNIWRMVDEKEKPIAHTLLASSPFVPDFLAYRALSGFKVPDHSTYYGIKDPRDHILYFQAKMQVVKAENPILYKVFFPILVSST